jgi:RimJ/RimL family protein N-acetyltransferase
VEFARFRRGDAEALVDLLAGNHRPFHSLDRIERATARQWVDEGRFDSAFWVGDRDGILRVDALGEDNPMLDIRLRAGARGRGVGTAAIGWVVGHVFGSFAGVRRIEATTRQDNVAMRRVF